MKPDLELWIRKRLFFWECINPHEIVGIMDSHKRIRALSKDKCVVKARKYWNIKPSGWTTIYPAEYKRY